MRVDYLRYFEHLAKVLNYTKAAQDLYIAQPTLSVAIKRMEKELGIQLFKRAGGGASSQRIELTETGAILQEYVAQALNSLDTGLRVAREKQGELNSSVRVGTIYAMQGRFWSQAIDSFQSSRTNPTKITFEQAYSPESDRSIAKRRARRNLFSTYRKFRRSKSFIGLVTAVGARS